MQMIGSVAPEVRASSAPLALLLVLMRAQALVLAFVLLRGLLGRGMSAQQTVRSAANRNHPKDRRGKSRQAATAPPSSALHRLAASLGSMTRILAR
jgi:hypothetical protein